MGDGWREWFDSWELTLEVRGRRPRTIAFYERELLRFAAHVDTPPLLVTKATIRQWLKDLIDSGLSAHTVTNRLVVIKSFFSWLVAEGEMPVSPAAGLSGPAHRGPDPDVLSDDEFDRLLAEVSGPEPLDRRNRAILLTLDSSGVRSAELVSMENDRVHLRDRRVEVEGKGGLWRSAPISAQAAEAIDRYRRVRSQLNGTPARLWWGHQGDLSARGLAHMLAKLGEATGVDVHPHRFRHRFSHRWLAAGGSEAGLQVAAGWSSSLMPRRYGRALSVERMLDEHRRILG
jgi:integrase/recombinase XerD